MRSRNEFSTTLIEEIIIAADEDWKDSGTFAGEGEVVHS